MTLRAARAAPARPWVVKHGEPAAAEAALVGGKAYHLARLAECGFAPPPWVVITTAARAAAAPAAAGGGAMHDAEIPAALRAAVADALREVGLAGARLAVRSSAAAEDGRAASFAGQFDTVLGVPAGDADRLWQAVAQVWRSAGSAHAAAYGARHDEAGPSGMAVVLQAMVEPEAAGVAFSVDPVRHDADVAVVSAVWGLGEGLVSGELDADTYRVAFRAGAASVGREIATKERRLVIDDAGRVAALPVEAGEARLPVLTDAEAVEIARAARMLAERLGAPQDVEWALAAAAAGGARRLVILQTRPVTTFVDPGERRIWDNSNIVESYGGVTTPLTFSFARSVYEDVYRQFCTMMGVSASRIEASRDVFANMLGLVRGRVYYNLLNWYRTLALLPGFALNREFMERMMGVRERLAETPAVVAGGGRIRDALRVGWMSSRMVRLHAGLARDVPAFHRRVDAVLRPLAGEELGRRSPDELLALYRRLERDLLAEWRTPLVNDFFAMIWFGVLGRLVERWLPDAPPTLVNDLISGQGGIVSAEPARRVAALAATAAATPAIAALLDAEPEDGAVLGRLAGLAEPAARAFERAVRDYLAEFGDRCMNELKLETVTLGEDPSFLIATLRQYVRRADAGAPPEGREHALRGAAEARVAQSLGGARLALFRRVLGRARLRVRDRENLRFERTRVFGVVRRIFLALGEHMARAGALGERRDVFYLTRDEIFGHVQGTGVSGSLRELVRLRRAEFERYAAEPPLPDRFETRGPPAAAARPAPVDAAGGGQSSAGEVRGTGCCPGIVRGPVRLVADPTQAGDLAGCILVAERTDPGWTLLFPLVDGLLVQRGSLLSHSAIVAREIGLPCVVGIPALMSTLSSGEWVEMDGATGVVRRVAGPEADDGG